MINTSGFETELKLVEARFLTEVTALLKRFETLSKQEQLALLREIDFMQRLNTHGINKLLGSMSTAMTKRIKELRSFYTAKGLSVSAGFSPLVAMANENLNMFIGQYGAYASGIKQNLIQGIAANTPNDVLIKQLQVLSVGTLSSKDAFFIMEETYARFDMAVKATIFEGKEDVAKWIYLGAEDNRNRDSCAAVLAQRNTEGWTMDEINAGEAHPEVDFVSRGGFNCRHDWVLADKQPEGTFE